MPCLGQAELAGLRAAEPLRMATDQRIAGTLPPKVVGRPAFTRAAVPRSILLLTWAKMPMAATTIVGGAIRAVDRVAHPILPPRGGRIVPE
jgi:hypothetical protein